jgi:hypothetical protein
MDFSANVVRFGRALSPEENALEVANARVDVERVDDCELSTRLRDAVDGRENVGGDASADDIETLLPERYLREVKEGEKIKRDEERERREHRGNGEAERERKCDVLRG